MPLEDARGPRETGREGSSSTRIDLSRTLVNDRQARIDQYRSSIKVGLIRNRELTEAKWEGSIKDYRDRLVRNNISLTGQIISDLTPIGREYSTKQLNLDDLRQRNEIDEEMYKYQENTLRTNFHIDRLLALEKIGIAQGLVQNWDILMEDD